MANGKQKGEEREQRKAHSIKLNSAESNNGKMEEKFSSFATLIFSRLIQLAFLSLLLLLGNFPLSFLLLCLTGFGYVIRALHTHR